MALLIFAGAVGKSGQFPLHVWLPDAMEGPTPISALIHAATMVAAGVFLVARTFDIFLASPAALAAVAYVGAFTALFAATIAVAQNDIKRILAYSTVSQLGYMMMAMGIGTLVSYAAGLFHLYTHAFFKALLFLAAGSVIHALNRQDIREMGGVGKQMKITMWTFAIGTLALSGIFPFSGFWSKDAILSAVYEEHRALFWIGWIAAFFTAFYMARLFFLVFAGEKRYDGEAHESPPVMTVPLVILAVLAVAAGFIYPPASGGFAAWLTGAELGGHANWTVMILSNLAGIAGLALGWLIYARGTIPRDLVSARAPGVVRMLAKKYYIDEFYEGVIVRGLRGLGCLLLAIDRYIVDGAVMLSAAIVRGVGNAGTRLQNGQLQTYGLITLLGFVIIFIALVGRRYFHVG
jgi:NADH-quinone oxidoreductase subunit L